MNNSFFLRNFGRIATVFTIGAVMVSGTLSAYTVPEKMAWWYEARFGMFIHFGSYSLLGRGEWVFSDENWSKSAYQTQVSANFNPVNFDATAIAAAAKAAGMKYLVITAKHHDGFSMWRTSAPSFTDVPGTTLYDLYHYTPFKRDILAELKAACEAQGIKFCLYYSMLDWNHSSQTITKSGQIFSAMSSFAARTAYIEEMKAHLADLIAKYDPAVMWFDGDWCPDHASPTLSDWWTSADGRDLYDYLIGLKPTLIVNERVKREFGLGDFECPEQYVPNAPLSRPWETNATMNDSWGYQSNKENSYRSVTTLVRELVRVVSRDGNYLLNIGPKGDGSVPAKSIDVLTGMGAWMNTYSESIYGTTVSPYPSEPSWGHYTKKFGRLYAHVFNWPSNGQLAIPRLKNPVARIYSLHDAGTDLAFTTSESDLVVSVGATAPNAIDAVIVVEVEGVPEALVGKTTNITTGGTASAHAENHSSENAGKAFDTFTATKWFTGTNGGTGWLQYQFGGGLGWKALQYRITSANDVSGRDPRAWQLLGSNDGAEWKVLDSQTAQTFSSRLQTLTYPVATPGNYRYYRLGITENGGGSGFGIQLSEFSLLPDAADLLDTTPPVITTPGGVTVTATSAAGAVVNFSVTATDAVNGRPTVVTSPASGAIFPIGTTLVQCSTTDFAGNSATASFFVNVNDPATAPPAAPANLTATPGSGQVALAWGAVYGATGYTLYRADTAGGPYTLLSTGAATSYTDAGLATGSAFYYRVTASNAHGEGVASAPVRSGPTGLPAAWTAQDIGVVGLAGSTSVGGGVFTVTGAGADIWNENDAFHFASRPWTGDGALVARVASLTNTDEWAKAGVMFRQSLAANSRHMMIVMTPTSANGVTFQGRTAGGSLNSNTGGRMPPCWVKLIRRGNTFTAFSSADGTTWEAQGSAVQNAMPASIYAGLAVTSHTTSARATARFEEIAFFAPPVLTVPANITVPASGSSGASVTFSPTATSNVDGSLVVTSTPASGSTFPVGTTTVECSVADSAGLRTAGSFTVTVTGTPAAPSGVTAQAGDGKVDLGWGASANATSYMVARATGGSGFSTLASGIGATSYQDVSVANGTTYRYTISAVNAAGGGPASAPVSATPIGAAQIVTPQITMSDGQARMELTTSVSGRRYQLQRSHTLVAGSWVNVGSAQEGGGALSFSDESAPGVPKVFYRVLIQQ